MLENNLNNLLVLTTTNIVKLLFVTLHIYHKNIKTNTQLDIFCLETRCFRRQTASTVFTNGMPL